MLKTVRTGLMLGVSLSVTTMAGAQTQPQPSEPAQADVSGDGNAIRNDDIVVTGQRRTTTAQNIGAAISVLGADALAASGTNSSMALQFATPGVTISQDLGLQTQIYIRGIGSNLQGIATGNSVATYVDGVYIPNSIQSAQQFSDVERVEVLKGPQATLYGRNATGGAVLVVSALPSFDFGGSADLSYGNYNAIAAHARVNVPVIADRLAFSIAGQVSRRDGYVRNLFTGNDIGYDRSQAIRGSIRAVLTDRLELILRGDYTHSVASDVYKLFPRTASYYYTPPNTIANQTPGPMYFSSNPREVYYDVDPRNPARDRGYSATFKWDSPIGEITSVTSRRLFDAGPFFADSDQVPTYSIAFGAKINTLGSTQGSDSFYHDTYLSTDFAGRFNVIIGANYFHDDQYAFDRTTIQSANAYANTEAWSAYLDATFDITDTLRLLGGVRYSEEIKSYSRDVLSLATGAITSTSSNRKSFDSTNPRFGIEWRPAPGTLIFATATSGFKSGGFNPTIPGNDFNPENIWAYEAGLKTRFWNDRIRFSASAFYYDYSDIQVLQYITIQQGTPPVATLVQNITNGATAKVWGVDLDATIALTERLTLNGAVSFLHTEFGSTLFCDPLLGSCTATNPANRPIVNVKGNPLTRAPEISANIGADYRVPVGEGAITLRANAAFRDRAYYTVFKNDFYSTDPYWLLGASIRYDAPNNWFIEAYGQNLANELAITNIIASAPVRNSATGAPLIGTPATFERYVPPRTYGVRVGFKF